jgi:hypothetical protein
MRFAVGGVFPDFISLISMVVQAEESRGRRLLRRGVFRKVKLYCRLPEIPSGRLLIEDPIRDPNRIQPGSKPDTIRDPIVTRRPLQVIYLVV